MQRRIRSENVSTEDFSSLGHGNAPSKGENSGKHSRVPSKSFLGVSMPIVNVNMNVNLDVRKWTWPESLTFGMGGSSNDKKAKLNEESDGKTISQARSPSLERLSLPQPVSETPIDAQSLAEALSSDSIHQSPKATVLDQQGEEQIPPPPASHFSAQEEQTPSGRDPREDSSQTQQPVKSDSLSTPPFTETYLHFDISQSHHTRRRLVRYLTVRLSL